MSAVRNLHDTDVGGRRLRIDLADSDPFLEGKTTQHGELLDTSETRAQWRARNDQGDDNDSKHGGPSNFLKTLPPGIPLPAGVTALDSISTTLASIDPAQLTEVLAQMKAFVINHPEQARILLVAHPQFAYALFQALLLQKIVDPVILQRMLAATQGGGQPPPPPPVAPHVPTPQTQPAMPPPYPYYNQNMPGMPPGAPAYYRPPPPGAAMGGAPPHASTPPMPPPQLNPAAAPSSATTQPPTIDPAQREMLMQVFRLTPDQINNLPPNDREAVQSLRSQYMGLVNPGA